MNKKCSLIEKLGKLNLPKNILVLGAARSGISSAITLKKLGFNIFVSDSGKNINSENKKKLLENNIDYELGGHDLNNFLNYQLIITSPGIPLYAKPLVFAKQKNIKIISEIELAYLLTESEIIAITGSNGKTTTSTLIYDILKIEFENVACGGNIGYPLIELSLENYKYLVAEISSYQLETIDKFKPKISLYLNLYENHLDRHKTMEEYNRLKERVFENQNKSDYSIVNYDNLDFKKIKTQIKSKLILFSTKNKLDKGVFIKDDYIYSNLNNEGMIISIKDINIFGKHNLENCVAAIAVCLILKVKKENIIKGIKMFKGIEHRLEEVKTINSIKYINDSKSTNYTSTIMALNSFDKKLILLAGGIDKGGDFSQLIEKMKNKVSHLFLFGEAKDIFANKLKNKGFTGFTILDSLEECVIKAHNKAKENDIVLLSPACSSFDQFDNFEIRGKKFKEYVRNL